MDTPTTLQIAAIFIVGFWSLVYMVWETAEDVLEAVHNTARRVVFADAYATFVKPRVLRRYQEWQLFPSPTGVTDRQLFAEICRLGALDHSEEMMYEDLCVDMVVAEHRCVPRRLVQRVVRDQVPTYRLRFRHLPQLWPFLLSAQLKRTP